MPNKRKAGNFNRFVTFFTVFIVCFFCFSLLAAAQKHSDDKPKDERNFVSKHSFSIVLLSGVTSKAEVTKEEGVNALETNPQAYIGLGMNYQHIITKKFYWLTGLHLTGSGRNVILNAPNQSTVFPAFHGRSLFKNNQVDFGIALPVFIEKYWAYKTHGDFYVNGGAQLHYSVGNDFESYNIYLIDSAANILNVLNADLNTNNHRKVWVTYSFGGGYQWKLKKGNTLKIGLQADLSSTYPVQGDYTINLPDNPITRSNYRVSGTHVAFVLGYGFTKPNNGRSHPRSA